MTSVPDGPPRRVSEEDRDAAVRRLQEAYAEEHISHEEMDERLHQVLTAGTQGELASALSSLPEEKADSSTIGAFTGRIRRSGAWRVPRFLKVESAYGRARLDLSRAIIEHPVVDIELALGTGGAKITVPRDATVDLDDLRVGMKAPRYKPPRNPRSGGPRIRITGAVGFGRLKIRHARR